MGSNGVSGFEDMKTIFRQVKPEWSNPDANLTKPFVAYVHGGARLPNGRSALYICVTDFQTNTFQSLKSLQDLEDLREIVGIGGPWSDFVDYVQASIRSEDVKLVLDGQSKSGGAASGKLIAQKAKGMPRISIFLTKLVDDTARSAMANISLELFKEYKSMHIELINEQERCYQLTKILRAEQEKNDSMQRQLDSLVFSRPHKSQKMSDLSTTDATQDSTDKQTSQTEASPKVPNRVVPAYRRAKVRGVVLQDTEDEEN